MAVRTDPRFGFLYGWASGDDGWGDGMNTFLEGIMWLFQQRILDTDLATPPGSPAIGDMYIPAPTATGAWVGHEGDIAIWWQGPADSVAAWKFFTLDADMAGVVLWLADSSEWIVWLGSAWEKKSEWDKKISRISILDRDLTAPPGSPSIGDAYIPTATATGVWASHEDDIAVWWQEPGATAAWKFFTPANGHRAYVEDEDTLVVWDGYQWFNGVPIDMPFELKLSRLSIADRDLTAPPGSPSIGDAYIPAATATGAWAGHEDDVAVWWLSPGDSSAAWRFHTPETGLRAYIVDEDVLALWDGTAWTPGLSV